MRTAVSLQHLSSLREHLNLKIHPKHSLPELVDPMYNEALTEQQTQDLQVFAQVIGDEKLKELTAAMLHMVNDKFDNLAAPIGADQSLFSDSGSMMYGQTFVDNAFIPNEEDENWETMGVQLFECDWYYEHAPTDMTNAVLIEAFKALAALLPQ